MWPPPPISPDRVPTPLDRDTGCRTHDESPLCRHRRGLRSAAATRAGRRPPPHQCRHDPCHRWPPSASRRRRGRRRSRWRWPLPHPAFRSRLRRASDRPACHTPRATIRDNAREHEADFIAPSRRSGQQGHALRRPGRPRRSARRPSRRPDRPGPTARSAYCSTSSTDATARGTHR